MLLSEVMDKPYKVELRKTNAQWIGKFRTDSRDLFKIKIDRKGFNVWDPWDFLFTDEVVGGFGGTDITGKGDQFRIFATIMDIFKKFAKEVKPKVINFIAKEDSRKSLYFKLIKKYARQLGYELADSHMSTQGTEYTLVRK